MSLKNTKTNRDRNADMKIRPYAPEDEGTVIELWRKCDLVRPQNNPKLDIRRKVTVDPDLFLVGLLGGKIVATVMGGYEGHRGWINYLGVDPSHRRRGLGQQIMLAVESKIRARGCPKINLQVRTDNLEVVEFYQSIGYQTDAVVSMGKRLVAD
jgi:ribosomal protein S18 acetylase RimI-like enzyme